MHNRPKSGTYYPWQGMGRHPTPPFLLLKGGFSMKNMKKRFLFFLAAALIALMLPLTVCAADAGGIRPYNGMDSGGNLGDTSPADGADGWLGEADGIIEGTSGMAGDSGMLGEGGMLDDGGMAGDGNNAGGNGAAESGGMAGDILGGEKDSGTGDATGDNATDTAASSSGNSSYDGMSVFGVVITVIIILAVIALVVALLPRRKSGT